MMNDWILPTLGALLFWGLWSFLPKITTGYLNPKSAIVFEAMGGMFLAAVTLASLKFQPDLHPKGIFLAFITGLLGFSGAFCFLNAVTKGPVTLVATISALYPVVSVGLSIAFLHETLTLRQSLGIILAFLAMILVAT